jgi:predicted RNase H-like HicB family nuclease
MRSDAVQSARLAIEIEWDLKDHVWIAQVPTLNHLSTHGDTYQEAVDKCREAILGFFEASEKESLPLPLTEVEAEILLASLTGHPKAS